MENKQWEDAGSSLTSSLCERHGLGFVTVLLSFWVSLCPFLTLLGPFIASASHLDSSVEYKAFHPRNCPHYVCLGLLGELFA